MRARLSSFIRCVDFVVMALIKRLVLLSVSDLAQQIEASINLRERPKSRSIDWREEREKANRITTAVFEDEVKIVSPMFKIKLVLSEHGSSAKKELASGRQGWFSFDSSKFQNAQASIIGIFVLESTVK